MFNFRALAFGCAVAAQICVVQAYDAPQSVNTLVGAEKVAGAAPLDEDYRQQFEGCDRGISASLLKDHFRGHNLRIPNAPKSKQFYLCSSDPSHVNALLKLQDGAVYWESKMALDVDGSWAAWNGIPGATDQTDTSFQWKGVSNKSSQAAQVNPDEFPFAVIPMNGIKKITGAASGSLGKEFSAKTGLALGDMGVVISGDKWSPAFIADGGPFMRLGEASSRVFENLGQTRCKKWNSAGNHCVGLGGKSYPYRNVGIGGGVVFIFYPNSHDDDLSPSNAKAKLCAFAKSKLALTGGAGCSGM